MLGKASSATIKTLSEEFPRSDNMTKINNTRHVYLGFLGHTSSKTFLQKSNRFDDLYRRFYRFYYTLLIHKLVCLNAHSTSFPTVPHILLHMFALPNNRSVMLFVRPQHNIWEFELFLTEFLHRLYDYLHTGFWIALVEIYIAFDRYFPKGFKGLIWWFRYLLCINNFCNISDADIEIIITIFHWCCFMFELNSSWRDRPLSI